MKSSRLDAFQSQGKLKFYIMFDGVLLLVGKKILFRTQKNRKNQFFEIFGDGQFCIQTTQFV